MLHASQIKINQKRQFWGTPSGNWPAFACQPALRSRQKHVFFSFSDVFVDFSCEIIEKGLKWKRLKMDGKSSTAPESWSKYTTSVHWIVIDIIREKKKIFIFTNLFLRILLQDVISWKLHELFFVVNSQFFFFFFLLKCWSS